MDHSKLLKAIKSIHPVSDNFSDTLKGMLVSFTLPKNHILVYPPGVCAHLYFIHRGFAMFYTDYKKKKNVEWFRKEGQFLLSSDSFFRQKPSDRCIQLMRRSDLWGITYQGIQRLCILFPESQPLFLAIILRDIQQVRQQLFDIKHLEANERFEKLLKAFPDIDRTVPQEAIASYLGITPQSFSRIKRDKG